MRKVLSISSTCIVFAGLAAEASELPSFEKLGFPITRTQVAVLGSTDVQESSPVPALTLAGMPASPNEVAVLTPRARINAQGAYEADTCWLFRRQIARMGSKS